MRAFILAAFVLFAGASLVAVAEDDIIVETKDDKIRVDDILGSTNDTDSDAATLNRTLASPNADTIIYFTYPMNPKELPTSKPIRMSIGFTNKGSTPFMVDYLDASLRYPMDYSYSILNFTTVRYSKEVMPQQQATFDYGFMLNDAFAQRPFGLSINLYYSDQNGNYYVNNIYNETVNIIEIDEGLDSQTFFLYLIFAAIVVLGLVGLQQFLTGYSKKRPSVRKTVGPKIESGTSRNDDVDYAWLPESTLRNINKSPKKAAGQQSPPQSPKSKKRE